MITVRDNTGERKVSVGDALALIAAYFVPGAAWRYSKTRDERTILVSGPVQRWLEFSGASTDMHMLRQAMVVHELEARKATSHGWDVDGYMAEVWRKLCYRLQAGIRGSSSPAGLFLTFMRNAESNAVRARLLLAMIGKQDPTDEDIRQAYGQAMELAAAA